MTSFSKKFCAKSPFKDRRTKTNEKGKVVDVPHDHHGSGKNYGEKGHSGSTTHWTQTSKDSGYRKPK
jgi:hypothetical protein